MNGPITKPHTRTADNGPPHRSPPAAALPRFDCIIGTTPGTCHTMWTASSRSGRRWTRLLKSCSSTLRKPPRWACSGGGGECAHAALSAGLTKGSKALNGWMQQGPFFDNNWLPNPYYWQGMPPRPSADRNGGGAEQRPDTRPSLSSAGNEHDLLFPWLFDKVRLRDCVTWAEGHAACRPRHLFRSTLPSRVS